LLLSLVIASVLLAILFAWGGVDGQELLATLKLLSGGVYAKALGVHFGIYLVRAARFRLLLPAANRPGLPALLAVSASHNLAAYVLPAKTGEGTLVLYLRKVCGVPASEGLATLVVSRLLDLATLSLMLSVATLILAGRGELAASWSPFLGAGLGALALILFVLSARSAWLVRCLTFVVRLLKLDGTRFGKKLLDQADGVELAFREAGGAGRLIGAALMSIPLWIGVFVFYIVLAKGFGIGTDLDSVQVTFASSWAMLANLLPINGFAGAGTQEGGWVFGFTRVGIDEVAAISSGVGVHLVQLFNVVLFGVMGHAAMAFGARD
jgi:uncharacterized protein (TIRG00374 family)